MHINKDEMATRHGAWGGATAGAVVGTRFPSALIGSAVVGGISGHLWRGMSRADVKEFGVIIDTVAGSTCRRRAEHLGSRSGQGDFEGRKRATKRLDGDLKDIDKAIQNTAMDAESLPF